MHTQVREKMASLIALLAIGCASGPVNPSFNLTPPAAREAIAQMRSKPVQLQRPLVIIGGFSDFGIGPAITRSKLAAMVGGDHRIITVSVPFAATFDDCRHDVIAAVDRAFPTTRPSPDNSTAEVDVIGLSMGGLVARYSAMPPSGRRLRIARLFTISSPLNGADLAALPTLDRKVRDMRTGSPMLLRLA